MGGSGARFGSSIPKQFHRISGKKIYQHTLERFQESRLFDAIVLVCRASWVDVVAREVPPSVRVIEGGETRQESAYRGLIACGPGTEIVVIHDAVRPFVNHDILLRNIAGARTYGAVDTCIPSTDTLVHAPAAEQIRAIPNRAHYLRGQTPQSFRYPLIFEAHERARGSAYSDDCRLVLEMGRPVHVVLGDEHNIKITTELDLFLAEHLFRLHSTSLQPNGSALAGKQFAVAGGTGGIGTALCAQLEQEGALAIPISRNAAAFPADLTAPDQAQQVFAAIHRRYGPLDGLINAVGLLHVKSVQELSPAEIERLISANLTAPIYCCQQARLRPGGHIVNVASSSYARGRKDYAVYAGAKAALVNFTQGLAEERPDLCVNAIVPQRTRTPMRTTSFPEEDSRALLDPCDVASAIINLLKHPHITGAIVEVRRPSPSPELGLEKKEAFKATGSTE
jgi:2-C-methyl-D-erythritol 4-phosphate cytidylyltransferase